MAKRNKHDRGFKALLGPPDAAIAILKAALPAFRRVVSPEAAEVVMSTIQEKVDELFQKKLRGLVEAHLRTKFGDPSADVLARLGSASVAELEGWSIQAFTAETVDEVFASRPRRTSRSRTRKKT